MIVAFLLINCHRRHKPYLVACKSNRRKSSSYSTFFIRSSLPAAGPLLKCILLDSFAIVHQLLFIGHCSSIKIAYHRFFETQFFCCSGRNTTTNKIHNNETNIRPIATQLLLHKFQFKWTELSFTFSTRENTRSVDDEKPLSALSREKNTQQSSINQDRTRWNRSCHRILFILPIPNTSRKRVHSSITAVANGTLTMLLYSLCPLPFSNEKKLHLHPINKVSLSISVRELSSLRFFIGWFNWTEKEHKSASSSRNGRCQQFVGRGHAENPLATNL